MSFNLVPPAPYSKIERWAELSECRQYRWQLRHWYPGSGNDKTVCFIMLNPSTADAEVDDPTIRRCLGFTKSWGYTTLSVANLFCLRATNPKELLQAENPIGNFANSEIKITAGQSELIVCAWGTNVPFKRDKKVLGILNRYDLYCLGTNQDSSPKHPLYVPAGTKPTLYRPRKPPPRPRLTPAKESEPIWTDFVP